MRRGFASLGLVGWLVATTGCSPGRVERHVTLHYTDAQRMFLVPVSRALDTPRDPAKAIEATLESLREPPSKELRQAIASGSHVAVRSLNGPHLELDVTIPEHGSGSSDEQFLASALVKTAATVVPLEDVRLRLLTPAGVPLKGTHLDLERPFSPTDPAFENLYQGGEETGLAAMLYFPLPGDSLLAPVRIPLPGTAGPEPVRETFARWHEGPPEDLQSFMKGARSARTRLGWAGIRGGEATVVWQNAPEATPSAIAIRSLVLTLTEFTGVQHVRIVTPAGPIQVRIGAFDLASPIGRPDEVNSWPEHAS